MADDGTSGDLAYCSWSRTSCDGTGGDHCRAVLATSFAGDAVLASAFAATATTDSAYLSPTQHDQQRKW